MVRLPRIASQLARITGNEANATEAVRFHRNAGLMLGALSAPPMLALSADLTSQSSALVALALALAALVLFSERAYRAALAPSGLIVASVFAAAAPSPHFHTLAAWAILTPVETAIVLAAALRLGALTPVAALLALAIAERVGLFTVDAEWLAAAALAAPASLSAALSFTLISAYSREGETKRAQEKADVSLSLDVHGVVRQAGGGALDLLNSDATRLLGAALLSRVHVADRPEFARALDEALNGKGEAEATIRLRSDLNASSSDGYEEPRFVWVEARFVRGRERSSSASTAILTLIDITRYKEIEERLMAVQRDAAATISLKNRLLANVSHELRTPLNAILGFSDILSSAATMPISPERRVEYAHIIHSSAEHLLSVVNLLLDTSRLEAGQFEITPEPFAVAPLIEACRDMLRLKAQEADVELDVALPDPECEIVADKRACRQILLNLVSNAVKFSKRGGRVSIETRVAGSQLEIAVADDGIGIAKEHLPRVGDPFFQARAGYDRAAEGAGLGLSLVRGLVGLHGGALTIESAPDVGTRVTVRCRSTAEPLSGLRSPQRASKPFRD